MPLLLGAQIICMCGGRPSPHFCFLARTSRRLGSFCKARRFMSGTTWDDDWGRVPDATMRCNVPYEVKSSILEDAWLSRVFSRRALVAVAEGS